MDQRRSDPLAVCGLQSKLDRRQLKNLWRRITCVPAVLKLGWCDMAQGMHWLAYDARTPETICGNYIGYPSSEKMVLARQGLILLFWVCGPSLDVAVKFGTAIVTVA